MTGQACPEADQERIHDLPERMPADDLLRRNAETFQSLIQNSPFGIYVVDADLRLAHASQSAHDVFGVEPLVGTGLEDALRKIWSDPFAGEAIGRFRHTLATGEPYVAKDTVERRADLDRVEAYDWRIERLTMPNGRFGVVCYFYDLSERHRMEGELRASATRLRASEERFRAAIRALEGVLWTNNAAGEMEGEQDGWAALTGQTPAEYDGFGWAKAVHPEDAQGTIDAWMAAIAERRPFGFEHRVRRHDGAWRLFSICAIPTFTDEGALREWVGVHTDITDRTAAEIERVRLAAIVEQSGDFIAASDAELRPVFLNEAGRKLVGLPDLETVARTRIIDFFTPESQAIVNETVIPAVQTNGSWSGELAFRHFLTGATIPVFYNRFIVRDRTGAVAGLATVTRDLTKSKRVEAELRVQQAQLQTVIETVPAAVWFTYDRDARRVTGNRHAAELLRLPLSSNHSLTAPLEELPQGFRVIRDGAEVPAEQLPMQRAARGEEVPSEECDVVFEDGKSITILIRAMPIRDQDGKACGAVCTAIDITERKRAEEVLRRSEQEFRALGEDQPNLCWMADASGWIYWYNKRWFEYTGTTLSDMEGWGWQSVHDPAVLPAVKERWSEAIASGTTFEMTFPLRQADGVFRSFLTRIVPMRDEFGKIVRWFGNNTDISEQQATEAALRESEEALRSLNEHLETRVAEEVTAREQAQHRLAHAQRMEALGQLAGGIAHDFNNVLQAVSGGLSLIERRAADSEAVRRLARMGADAAERGAAITGRLLAFARKSELRAGPVRLLPLLQSVQEILASTLGAGIDVRIAADADIPPLTADRAQLETVLINLAVNARDAMATGGTLTISAGPEAITDARDHPSGLRSGVYLRLDLTDTGCGMDAATLARASEPFFTTKPTGQGTGLGLAMARGFAKQSDGGFAIRSAPGRGTTVTLWFPQAGSTADVDKTAIMTPPSDGSPALVMVVDDDAIVREMLTAQMTELGYQVVQASDGLAALAMLEKIKAVDLIVTDLSMPGMNGLTLIQEARRRQPKLPALLLTGYADASLEVGIDGAPDKGTAILRKPVIERELAERAAAMLARKA